MALIDELSIHISAGKGGDGVVRWRREKGLDHGGPAGGNGGKGGDVYVVGLRDVSILGKYRNIKDIKAKNGEPGAAKLKQGPAGRDLMFEVPLGSIVTNLESGRVVEALVENEQVLILHGGRGGLGNDFFKNSINRSPTECTPGAIGESADFKIELRLIADAGFIGLPNAGKSSLLNALTRAKAKIGDYQFTTLEPNLGSFYGYILADIPGLIEGASEGKGLGHKFLRHITRTKVLLHCISLEEKNILGVYKVVREELKKYTPELMDKKEVVILTKTDMVEEVDIKKAKKDIEKLGIDVLTASILDDASVKKLGEDLIKMFEAGEKKEEEIGG